MNLFEANLEPDGDGLAVSFGGYRLRVPPEVLAARPALARVRGQEDRPRHPSGGDGGRVARGRRARGPAHHRRSSS